MRQDAAGQQQDAAGREGHAKPARGEPGATTLRALRAPQRCTVTVVCVGPGAAVALRRPHSLARPLLPGASWMRRMEPPCLKLGRTQALRTRQPCRGPTRAGKQWWGGKHACVVVAAVVCLCVWRGVRVGRWQGRWEAATAALLDGARAWQGATATHLRGSSQ